MDHYYFSFTWMILRKMWNILWNLLLFSIVNDPVTSADELNHYLEVINHWAYLWKMEFNRDSKQQTSELLFSCKKNCPDQPSLFFNGTMVQTVNGQKHLGLFLDSKLSFERHQWKKSLRLKKAIGIIIFQNPFPLRPLIKGSCQFASRLLWYYISHTRLK